MSLLKTDVLFIMLIVLKRPVVFVHLSNFSQHQSMKVEMLFHRSWSNTVVYATAKHLGNVLSAGLLCCSESLTTAIHFTWTVEVFGFDFLHEH